MAAFSSCCCFFLLDALLPDCDTCALTVTILLVVALATIVPDVVELTIGVATLPPTAPLFPVLIAVAAGPPPTELKEFMFDGAELLVDGGGAAIAVTSGAAELLPEVSELISLLVLFLFDCP